MIYKLLMLMGLIACCTGCESYFDPGPRVGRDGALIDDLRALDLPRVARGEEKWFIGRITLNKDAYTPVGHESADGKVVHMDVAASGTCVILDPLNAALDAAKFDFHFDNAHAVWANNGSNTRPFMLTNGILLLRFNAAMPANDVGRFPEGYLLADDSWAADMSAAWKYVHEHPTAFENTAASRQKLDALVHGENQVLAIAAFRHLVAANLIDPRTAVEIITAARCPTQGVFLYDYLNTLKEESAEAAAAPLVAYVKQATTFEELEGIALAAPEIAEYTAPAGHKVSVRIREAIVERISHLKGDPQLKAGMTNLAHRDTFSRE